MAAIFATIAITTDAFVVARDGLLHLADPARPSVPVTYVGARRIDGAPSRARCGAVATVSANRLAAEQLYGDLTECRECTAWAEMREVIEAMTVEDGTLSMAETVRLDRRKHALRDEIEALAAARVVIRA